MTSITKTRLSTNASVIGHGDECGMSTISAVQPSTSVETCCLCPSSSATDDGTSSSQFAYALVTVGIVAKLYSGGGDGIVHSSVGPCHGSGPDGAPRKYETTRFAKSTRMPTAVM